MEIRCVSALYSCQLFNLLIELIVKGIDCELQYYLRTVNMRIFPLEIPPMCAEKALTEQADRPLHILVEPALPLDYATGPSAGCDSNISISSTMTASDLPGPGRALGNLYSRAGKILEVCIARFAYKCGFGPHAVAERFVGAFNETGRKSWSGVRLLRRTEITQHRDDIATKTWFALLGYLE